MRPLHWALSVLILVPMLSCSRSTAPKPAPPARDGVLIHLTRGPEDPHRALMALNMAVMMAAEKDVAVYLDIKGIELVLRDAPDVQFDGFPSSLTSLQALQKAGVMVMACPGCLKAAGKTPEDLMPLAHAATKECFFSFTQGRILTLDY